MSEQTYHVQYGATTIHYTLIYAHRKTLAISVAPDLSVSVSAPEHTPHHDVEARIRRRAPWILRQQRELERYLPQQPPRQYVSGETHRYLGRQYRLKVLEGSTEAVKLTRGWLHVCTERPKDTAHIKALLDAWYRKQAERVFCERLQAVLPRFAHLGVAAPKLVIKQLEARWGSCNNAGVITLNLRLMQVPKQYIDYVLAHELAHVVEHNHSKRFYALLDRIMPDWPERRRQLNEVALP